MNKQASGQAIATGIGAAGMGVLGYNPIGLVTGSIYNYNKRRAEAHKRHHTRYAMLVQRAEQERLEALAKWADVPFSKPADVQLGADDAAVGADGGYTDRTSLLIKPSALPASSLAVDRTNRTGLYIPR